MTILVVDDEALLVKGIRFNLKSDGYDVITGSNGQEAVELTKSENPDLVVLDVMMPVMDGLTACSRIREFSDVPIILLTAKVKSRRSTGSPAATSPWTWTPGMPIRAASWWCSPPRNST